MAGPLITKTVPITIDVANDRQPIFTEMVITPAFVVFALEGNTGSISIGGKEVDNVVNIPRTPGSFNHFSASGRGDATLGDYFDLSQWYINADNSGDGVIVEYYASGTGVE